MTGALIAASIHGTVLSILLARAISSAPADQGLVKRSDGLGCAGLAGCAGEAAFMVESGFEGSEGMSKEGDRSGEEKERR